MTTSHFTQTYNSTWPAFNLRMEPAMKIRLQAAAEENKRSLNSEIVWRLTQSLDGWKR